MKRPLTVVWRNIISVFEVIKHTWGGDTHKVDEPVEHNSRAVADVQEGKQAKCDDNGDRVDWDTTLGAFGEDLGSRARDGQGIKIPASGVGVGVTARPTSQIVSMETNAYRRRYVRRSEDDSVDNVGKNFDTAVLNGNNPR